jgi:hypothetical protein
MTLSNLEGRYLNFEKHEASFFTVELYGQFASKVVTQTHGKGRGNETWSGKIGTAIKKTAI